MTRDPRIQAARALRRDASPEARRLWGLLLPLNRAKRAHFRRQAVIGPVIASFADLSRRLVIELGPPPAAGATDAAPASHDWLSAQGFRLLHIDPDDLADKADHVLARILAALAAPHPLPPHKGEGSDFATKAAACGPLPLVGRDGVGGGLPSDGRGEGR
jgi:very-short-patch-repair endonuclease